MKKVFLLLVVVAMICITSNLTAKTSDSSPPAETVAVDEAQPSNMTTMVNFEATQQPVIQATIVEGLANNEKVNFSSMILKAKNSGLLMANTFMINTTGTDAAALLRDDRSHILKALMTSASMENVTGQSFNNMSYHLQHLMCSTSLLARQNIV